MTDELMCLFFVCRQDQHETTEDELDVIEAAQDWANAQEGSKYGPIKHEIRRAETALINAVSRLAAENDGVWRRPA